MREAISQAIMEEMDRDPAVFIIGEEVGVWGGTYAVTKGFYDKYGSDRIKDTPIAENAIIGAAIGAAMVGQRPIAELMTINFAFSAMDYIVNQAPKLHYMFGGQFKVPMVIRAVGGGGRQLGATHSQTPDAIFAHFPGLTVVSPGTPEDAKGLLKSAIRSNDPVLFIEHATMYQVRGEVPDEEYLIPIGKSKVQRAGKDVTIVTYGALVERSNQAAKRLEQKGVSVEIIDLRTLVPYDWESIAESVKKTSRVIVAHEDPLSWGYGAEIAARISDELFEYLDAPVRRVGATDTFVAYAPQVEDFILPQSEDVENAVNELMKY